MRFGRSRILTTVFLGSFTLAAVNAAAQTCQGSTRFPSRRAYHTGATFSSATGATSGSGVFLSGDKGGYVGVQLGQLRDQSRGGSSLLLHVYGAMHTQKGEQEPARQRLEAAVVIFQRLGARKDAERTERALTAASCR